FTKTPAPRALSAGLATTGQSSVPMPDRRHTTGFTRLRKSVRRSAARAGYRIVYVGLRVRRVLRQFGCPSEDALLIGILYSESGLSARLTLVAYWPCDQGSSATPCVASQCCWPSIIAML